MIENSKLISTEVAIIKSTMVSKSINKGIEQLGGISSFVESGDQIFININLRIPYGFPVNVNFESLRDLIVLCKEAGAKQVFIGNFPVNGAKAQAIASILGIQSYFKNLGAELVFFEDQEKYPLEDYKLKERIVKIPKIVLNSDKLILFNQVSVDPLFKITLSVLNSYSLVPTNYQRIKKVNCSRNNYLLQDQYKQDLISNILDIYSIKKPTLVINDMFYFLESAGPYVYKDSNLIFTGLYIIGRDAIAVDFITLSLVGIDPLSSDIILEARRRNLGITDLSKIKTVGESKTNINLNVKFTVDKLDDISIKNTAINAGRICSGCYREAYYLLNSFKTHMTKDLKYIKRQQFLVGENPPEPNPSDQIIIFGDCAIESTKNQGFRTIRTSSDRNYIESVKERMKKDYKASKRQKIKERKNKAILELPGCPPDLNLSLLSIQRYYGKSQTPFLSFYAELMKTYYKPPSKSTTYSGEEQ